MKTPDLAGFASRRMLVVSAVLFLSIGVTMIAWHVVQLSLRNSTMRTFEEHVARTERAIQDRMRGHQQVLLGGAGLFAASESVTRDEWRRYVEAARIREVFPGVRGLHFASRVASADLAAHVADIRAGGFPAYSIRPEGARDEYYPILWPEPQDDRNRRAIGFDMFSEPVRRAAMEKARDSGKPTISGKVTLTGDAANPIPGFNYYMPIYKRDMPLSSPEERQRAIRGFIFCPFRMIDLMQGLLGQEREVMNIEIYDGTRPTAAGLMFDDDSVQSALNDDTRPALSVMREIRLGERSWVVYFEASPAFKASIDNSGPSLLLLAGLLISAVMAVAVWRMLTREDRAVSASLHDGLTGLHNRRFLEASLKREEHRARRSDTRVAIVQLDLDFFKKLNDTYGHAAGDEVLRRVGDVLRVATRSDDIVCRYGGEEFTLILPGASLTSAEARALKISKHISKLSMSLDGQPLPKVTISGGVAVFPDDGDTLETVLKRADKALLRAKREGRARILIARPDDPTTTLK